MAVRSMAPRMLAAVFTALSVAACATAPAGPAATPSASVPGAGTSPVSTVAVPTPLSTPIAPASQPAPSAGPTVRPSPSGASSPQVNLVFTGTSSFSAVGAGGHCPIFQSGTGSPGAFGFDATEAEFRGLGVAYSMWQPNPANDYVDIKWLIDNTHIYARPGPIQPGRITLSADHRSVDIDTDLAPFGNIGAEHVKGTITCP